jgi:hypothetical protein
MLIKMITAGYFKYLKFKQRNAMNKVQKLFEQQFLTTKIKSNASLLPVSIDKQYFSEYRKTIDIVNKTIFENVSLVQNSYLSDEHFRYLMIRDYCLNSITEALTATKDNIFDDCVERFLVKQLQDQLEENEQTAQGREVIVASYLSAFADVIQSLVITNPTISYGPCLAGAEQYIERYFNDSMLYTPIAFDSYINVDTFFEPFRSISTAIVLYKSVASSSVKPHFCSFCFKT